MCMVMDNLGLVHHTIRRYYSWSTSEYDDLYQIGCIGLMKAANRFDEYGVETKYLSINQASCKSGIARNTILSACNGKKTRGNLKWRFA